MVWLGPAGRFPGRVWSLDLTQHLHMMLIRTFFVQILSALAELKSLRACKTESIARGTLDELPSTQYARRRSALSVPPFFSCDCVLAYIEELHDKILNHSVSVPTMQCILIMALLVRTVNSMKLIFFTHGPPTLHPTNSGERTSGTDVYDPL